jgi:hypothetical protein
MKGQFFVNIHNLVTLHKVLCGNVKYRFGAKARSLKMDLEDLREIDCSGYFRLALYWSTTPATVAPDGSSMQREWCERMGFKKLDHYSDVQYATHDASRLFACFLAPLVLRGVTLKAGHVWFVHQGKTIESRGSRIGVSSRHWNQNVFRIRRAVAFELPTSGG